jgi:hypothetical protein
MDGGREEGWVNEGDGLMERGLDSWMDGRMGWIDGWGAEEGWVNEGDGLMEGGWMVG